MGLFNIRKNKVSKIANNKKDEINKFSQEEIDAILLNEIETLFPRSGRWSRSCFRKPTELEQWNMPCHLRDNKWLSQYIQNKLANKGVSISVSSIQNFINHSARFNELRHSYELEIVKWQIDWMRNDGEGWLMPDGYDEFTIMFSPDAVEIFRGGVVKTLTTIGMDSEVVEEGIEKNADLFRDRYIQASFRNEFEPVIYLHGSPIPANEEHKKNWLKAKRYEYYCKHKQSVDKYGTPHPDMLITSEEIKFLYDILPAQNLERKKIIEEWRTTILNGFCDNLNKKNSNTTVQEETLNK